MRGDINNNSLIFNKIYQYLLDSDLRISKIIFHVMTSVKNVLMIRKMCLKIINNNKWTAVSNRNEKPIDSPNV